MNGNRSPARRGVGRIPGVPPFVALMGLFALSMYIPAIVAASARDWQTARSFLQPGTLFLAVFAMVAFATAGSPRWRGARGDLMTLLAAFSALPLMLALPLWESLQDRRYLDVYFEMVSSVTTTGATVFDDPARLSGADHLWRALVGWLGGLLMWTAAAALLEPLGLGGFEILRQSGHVDRSGGDRTGRRKDGPARLRRHVILLFPAYATLTLVLWAGLMVAGGDPLSAACHAMSTMATSGISPIGGIDASGAGLPGEMMVFVFFGFALSRRTFSRDHVWLDRRRLTDDPEIRMGLFFAVTVPLLLVARHFVGVIEEDAVNSLGDGLKALWGMVFMVMSFLSTTGFESAAWESALDWSGLEVPGLTLLGLAMIGGGVATTAGGVKLLRVYVLYCHANRELERLVHPSSVGGSGGRARYLRRQGAYMAWIFFMLFAISIAVVMLALSLAGLDFETALTLTIAALSNTGPLASIAGETPLSYAVLPDAAKLILAGSMVLGRLETLAIIALLNPELWRR